MGDRLSEAAYRRNLAIAKGNNVTVSKETPFMFDSDSIRPESMDWLESEQTGKQYGSGFTQFVQSTRVAGKKLMPYFQPKAQMPVPTQKMRQTDTIASYTAAAEERALHEAYDL